KKNIEVDLRIACSKFRKAIDRRKHPARYSQSRFEYGISEISYILEIFSSKDSQKEVLQTINWLFENGPEFLTRYEANRLIELNLMNHAQLERLKRILDLRIINQGKFYYEEEKKLMSENKHYIT
ncbi:MAG: hypothetical protein MRY83_13730, partial [Flavobacteriales bacterium]|nr:hypothetical protein [Flavobacteriales bacterium]